MKFLKPTAWAAALVIVAGACNRNNEDSGNSSSLKKDSKSEEITLNDKNPAPTRWEQEKRKQSSWVTDTINIPAGNSQFQQRLEPGGKTTGDWDKKIIKTATINIEVRNYRSFTGLMRDNIKKFGGYVAQEEQNENDYKIENTIAVKVPVDQFEDLVNELTKGEEKILEKKITSEDVTTGIIDTKSRLEAKKQVRLRYLDLLKQAKNMQDILNVQSEINGVQEDIEAAAGRIAYLSHSSSFSTINLTYFQVLDVSAKNQAEPSYGTKVWQSFKNGWNWIGDVFVGLISIWPLFLVGFACWFAYKKWLPGKMQKKNA